MINPKAPPITMTEIKNVITRFLAFTFQLKLMLSQIIDVGSGAFIVFNTMPLNTRVGFKIPKLISKYLSGCKAKLFKSPLTSKI